MYTGRPDGSRGRRPAFSLINYLTSDNNYPAEHSVLKIQIAHGCQSFREYRIHNHVSRGGRSAEHATSPAYSGHREDPLALIQIYAKKQ